MGAAYYRESRSFTEKTSQQLDTHNAGWSSHSGIVVSSPTVQLFGYQQIGPFQTLPSPLDRIICNLRRDSPRVRIQIQGSDRAWQHELHLWGSGVGGWGWLGAVGLLVVLFLGPGGRGKTTKVLYSR
jgi:hypothetical protein